MLSPHIIKAAQDAERRWGVPACVGLAQCIQESSGFKLVPHGSNNGLGIKELTGLPYVVSYTHEVVHGKLIEIEARFAKFDSIEQCFDKWGQLLASNAVYRDAFKVRDDWSRFIVNMAPHYATDPNYARELIKIVNGFDLAQYNLHQG